VHPYPSVWIKGEEHTLSKRRTEDFVTRGECTAINTDMKADLKLIKVAVVGADMRGGMVRDIADLRNKVDGIVSNRIGDNNRRKEERAADTAKAELSMKWKITLVVAAFSSATAVIVELIRLGTH
jgi:hypothetical protein